MDKQIEDLENKRTNILIVDDEPSILDLFKRIFSKTCNVSAVLSGDDAVILASNRKYDLAFVDVRLASGEDGVEVIKKLKDISPAIVAIMMTAHEVNERLAKAFEYGADELVKKPFPSVNSILSIREAAEFLKMDKITIYKLVKNQQIPAMRLGKQWRLRREKIVQWMKEKESEREIRG